MLFAFGLGLAGLLNPSQIQAFLDITGHWNPAPLVVMATAMTCYGIGYRIILRLKKPLLVQNWHLPTQSKIDARLVVGSILFGIGWGLVGYCPGPALAALAFGRIETVYFVGAMLAGGAIFQFSRP